MKMMAASDFLAEQRRAVENRLKELLPGNGTGPERLLESMRHGVVLPAKRVRPLLTLVTARELGGRPEAALDLGCAIEMVHAASLILDDLPTMDNAELRRGVPANHLVYGESTAILAAIGLMNLAFGIAAKCQRLPPESCLDAVDVLYRAIGTDGLVGGQEEDLHACTGYTQAAQLERMYGRKTGALFAAAMELGAITAGRNEVRGQIARCGHDIGIGFQILDDVVDAEAESHKAGKDVMKDSGRANFASLIGTRAARSRAASLIDGAVQSAIHLAARHGGTGRHLAAFTEDLARAFDAILSKPDPLPMRAG